VDDAENQTMRLIQQQALCDRGSPVGSVADFKVAIRARRNSLESRAVTLTLGEAAPYALERHEVRGLAATLDVVVARSAELVQRRTSGKPVVVGRAGDVGVWWHIGSDDGYVPSVRVVVGKEGDATELDLTQTATLAALLRVAADEAAR
jgi:hypothetical protein